MSGVTARSGRSAYAFEVVRFGSENEMVCQCCLFGQKDRTVCHLMTSSDLQHLYLPMAVPAPEQFAGRSSVNQGVWSGGRQSM